MCRVFCTCPSIRDAPARACVLLLAEPGSRCAGRRSNLLQQTFLEDGLFFIRSTELGAIQFPAGRAPSEAMAFLLLKWLAAVRACCRNGEIGRRSHEALPLPEAQGFALGAESGALRLILPRGLIQTGLPNGCGWRYSQVLFKVAGTGLSPVSRARKWCLVEPRPAAGARAVGRGKEPREKP